MQVFVEYVVIDNMIIDTLILLITCKLNKIDTKKWKMLLISLYGTLVALLSPLISGIWLVLVKIICGLSMPLFLLKKPNIKQYIIVTLSFFLSTMLLGGVCLGFCSMFSINYIVTNGTISIYNFPVGLALTLGIATYFVLKSLITHFFKVKQTSKFIYDIQLEYGNVRLSVKAFLDSGNRLVDHKTNKPVNLVDYEILSQICPNITLADILLKRYEKLKLNNLHEMEVKSVAKCSKILVFEIDNIIIEDKVFNGALVGFSPSNFNSTLNADCLLSPLLFE